MLIKTAPVHKTKGFASHLIAASDAPADIKRIADYICDGTADEVQINAALGDNRHVVLSSGTFNINAAVIISYDNVILEGQGPSTIINNANTSGGFNCVYQSGANYNIVVRNFDIDNNNYGNPATPQDKGLFINGNNTDITQCHHILIEGIVAHDAQSEAICVDYSEHVTIRNCYSYNSAWSGITACTCRYVSIYNNHVFHCGEYSGNPYLSRGICILGCVGANVYDNIIEDCQRGGIGVNHSTIYTATGECSGINIFGNYIKEFDNAAGIVVDSSDSTAYTYNVNIADNHIRATAEEQQGIWLDYIKNFTVRGNTIEPHGSYWVYVDAHAINGIIFDNRFTSGKAPRLVSGSTSILCGATESIHLNNIRAIDDDYIHTFNNPTQGMLENDPISPDCPRTVTYSVTNNNITAFTLLIYGWDQFGNVAYWMPTDGDGWSGESSIAFSRIDYVKVYAMTGSGVGDTIKFGIGNKIGICSALFYADDLIKATRNGADIALPTVDITNALVTLSTIVDDDSFTIYHKKYFNRALTT